MPSKLRKAIGAVKDQTSISIAKVSNNNSSNLEVAILKATTHEEIPIEDRYINEVILLTSSSKIYAAACAQAIGKRISRTRNWIVALKSLMLVLRIFQNGEPQFHQEVLHAMKRGAKILNLSSFRDDSNSSPWDYTAFVRTFALFLDERLNCFLMGKLQRCVAYGKRETPQPGRRNNEPVRDMKPVMLLNKISYWQKLLDRVLATRPTGAAKTNRLVQISLYSVVRESFDLYKDISDGLALLLDSFFQLKHQSCVNAFQTCVKASKQFEELCSFYSLCKSIGVGRISEYPSVQKISDELIDTLQEFIKDQASFPSVNGKPQGSQLLLPEASEQSEISEHLEGVSERDSDMGFESHENRIWLEDLISVTDAGTSPSVSLDQEQHLEQFEKRSQIEESLGGNDLLSFDDRPEQEHQNYEEEASVSGSAERGRDCWELALMESSTQSSQNAAEGFEPSFLNSLYNQASIHQHHNNPFLQDISEITATTIAPVLVPVTDSFSSFPTFQATPTFCAKNPSETKTTLQIENDPFAPCSPQEATDQMFNGAMNQQHLLHEQQLWLQHQNKIIARHIA